MNTRFVRRVDLRVMCLLEAGESDMPRLPINTGASAFQMAQTIFGDEVSIVSAAYNGQNSSSGIYSNGDAISTAFADQAASAVSAPCWAVMASFDARPAFMQSGLRRQNVPLTWIANNANKPGRDELSSWVGHASADWSREHLEMTPEDVLPLLMSDLKSAIGIEEDPVFASAHRWRYSQITEPLGKDCLWDNALKLGVCGDWLLGDKVEHAWLSGRALSDSIRV